MMSDINEFFEKVRTCEMAEIDIYNYTKKITDNFQLDALKMLDMDFLIYFSEEQEIKHGSYSDDEIEKALMELHKQGKPFPTYRIAGHDVLDNEKLLYPHEFFGCYRFEALLKKKIKEKKAEAAAVVDPDKTKKGTKSDTVYKLVGIVGYRNESDFKERLKADNSLEAVMLTIAEFKEDGLLKPGIEVEGFYRLLAKNYKIKMTIRQFRYQIKKIGGLPPKIE